MNVCGIYQIRNLSNNKVYVGQSIHTYNRWHGYKGSVPWNLGKAHTPTTRERISRALTGKPHTPESNKKRSETLRGRIFTEEHRHKLSIAALGKNKNRGAL